MNAYAYFICLMLVLASTQATWSQEEIIYKTVDSVELKLKYYKAQNSNTPQPALVFFFGGGWKKGDILQFEPHAKYFSQRGIACFLVDYRVKNRHQTSPFESLKDAKSAFRYLREHAVKFKIDSNKICGAGASAGGQLVAAAALVEGYNEISDNLEVSCKPNALVLFNPAIDNGPGGIGYSRIGPAYKDFSPLHNIKNGAPPTIILQGTKDYLIPVETVQYYKTVMKKIGSRCDLHLYQGKNHGFFNYNKFQNYKTTLVEVDQFLQSLGYLDKTPIIEIK